MEDERRQMQKLIAAHDRYRGRTLNLIASENALSPTVRAALQTDLLQRYGDYTGRDLGARRYRGNHYIEEIEREAARIAQQTFSVRCVELRPISGHVAGAAVLMGLCRPGDLVLEPGRDVGGHREAGKLTSGSLLSLRVKHLPVIAECYNIDVPAAVRMIEEERPRAVILGSSNFLFPHPVAALAEALKRYPGTVLIYDASHVMGLVASGAFQDPLREGADIVFGSTHKTLPGPQGGIIFSNRDALMEAITEPVYPGLVTNHHPFRIPALALALLEMQEWGASYSAQVIANTQAMGEALAAEGIRCVNVAGRYSRSHTLLICLDALGSAAWAAERLEDAGIITTGAHLPEYWGTQGVRIGTQEITRLGASEEAMPRIARWIAEALAGARDIAAIAADTARFAASLGPERYTWDD